MQTVVNWGGHVNGLRAYGDVDAFVVGGPRAALLDITGREIRRLCDEDVNRISVVGDRAILAPYNKLYAVDISTGKRTWAVMANSDIALTVGGDVAITVSNWSDLRAWDLATGEPRGGFRAPQPASVLVHPDGKRVITSDHARGACVWDIESGQSLATFGAFELFGFLDDDVVVGFEPSKLGAWRMDGQCVWSLELGPCTPAVLLPDRKRVLCSAWGDEIAFDLVEIGSDRRTRIPGWKDPTKRLQPVRILPVAGERAIVDAGNGTIVALDLTGGPGRVLGAHGGSLCSMTAVGGHAITGAIDGRIIIWDLDAPAAVEHTGAITAILPRAGDVVTTSEDGTIKRWVGDRCTQTWSAGRGRIMAAAFAPDGTLVTCKPDEPMIRIWDLAAGTNRELKGATSPYAPPPGLPGFHAKLGMGFHVAVAADRIVEAITNHVVIWDPSGKLISALDGGREITGVAMHRDRVITCGEGVWIWNADGHARLNTERMVATISIAGDTLLAACANTVQIWNLARAEREHVLAGHERWISAVATDGKRALSGDQGGLLILWDLAERRELARWQSNAGITACAFTADGRVARGESNGAFSIL